MAQLAHHPPSAALIQMCQIQLRGKRPGSLLIGAIMEFHGNKLPWLTVTVQWLGPTLVMWPWRASSLWEAIMGKWSFAIELCNDKYWLISVGLTVLSVKSPIIAALLWVHHNPLLLFSLTSRTHTQFLCFLISMRSTTQNEILAFVYCSEIHNINQAFWHQLTKKGISFSLTIKWCIIWSSSVSKTSWISQNIVIKTDTLGKTSNIWLKL